MVKAMCGQNVVYRKTEEQMDMLGLKETIECLGTTNGLDGKDMCRGGMTIVL